jgi:beta-fructofuranosidase
VHQFYYQPADTWFGDCMPFFHDGRFYLFHQRDTRRPGPFGEPFGWALARTTDFVTYEDLGESVLRGTDDEQDQFIFAGSVFEAHGTFHAMYTGFNRDYAAQGKAAQVLMIATSDDLIHWTKTGRQLVVPQEGYDPNDWRDPFVLFDDETNRFVMILGARKQGSEILTGRTVWFTSTDLKTWDFQGDFWAPGLFSMHEMPDLFRMGDYWYLLTTEYSDKSKTVYRMSTSLEGPWTAPADDAFDGRAYYAARSIADADGRRFLFGWVPTKENEDELAPWQWGGTLVVHEVVQRRDGSLAAAIPARVAAAFGTPTALTEAPVELTSVGSSVQVDIASDTGDVFLFSADVEFAEGTRSFSVRLFEDPETGDGYEYLISLVDARLTFDRRPNYPWYRYDNKGLERPLHLEPGVSHHLELVADGTICTLYIDGVALNARMYAKAGTSIRISVVDGHLEIRQPALAKPALG